uniref:Protein MEMO1 n=1 Tax=Ditylenchus dipsaci TaxID=166011 RepID=A0A915D5Q8_9BILA
MQEPQFLLQDEAIVAFSCFHAPFIYNFIFSTLARHSRMNSQCHSLGSSGSHGHNGHHIRHASHAGSWYSDNAKELDRQLGAWLDQAGPMVGGAARAVITPHAGYTYCGDTAAFAFKQVVPDKIKRIFVLGPSHVVYLGGCALTTCSKYRTPLVDLAVDTDINNELMAAHEFEWMGLKNEEAEHSIEMQMPFIAKIMEKRPEGSYKIVPVLVGSLSTSRQTSYGKVFAKYIADPQNLFVISSDFCHWGNRFRYTPNDPSSGRAIHEQIATLDQRGMDAICAMDPPIFNDYLKKTQNTICGRNPICVMLQAAEHFRQMNNHTAEMRFLRYSQSNKCRVLDDSSVSYAAGVLYINPKM